MTFRLAFCFAFLFSSAAVANPPVASYIFPAGGQRGTKVAVRVGGLFLHEKCGFHLDGTGLTASKFLTPTRTLWFEGPLLPLPESQQQEDYPADMAGTVEIAKDAPLGPRRGWLTTAQGGAGGLVFVVGELPQVLEREVAGDPIPHSVLLPVTANGRIFPRDDLDLWEFEANAGQTVTATAIGKSLRFSPLAPKLEVLDSSGRVLAENMMYPVPGSDGSVKFTAAANGRYRIRIGDANAQGGQAYVYRLTITTDPVPEFQFPLKVPADELKDVIEPSTRLAAPVALNGRIATPGAVQEWKVELKKAAKYNFDLQARRFDSPLCGVVTVLDSNGKEVARGATADSSQDPAFAFQPPADGMFAVRIGERFRGRGGPNFVYRLRIADASVGTPGFKLNVAEESVTVLRGGSAKLRVNLERIGGFNGPVELNMESLPAGVSCKQATIAANQNSAELTFQTGAKAPLATLPLVIVGTANGGKPVRVLLAGNRFLPEGSSPLLTVGIPTPFKIVDDYVMTSAPRGEVYRRKYRIERDPGYTGAIEVRLADRQARHLQGVTGPVIAVSPGQTEVEYPASLPPWMELGRTCRVCVMAVGKVMDFDGSEHSVSFSSVGQNQQMIVVVGPGRLDVALDKRTVRAEPGGEVRVPVKVTRARELSGPVTVEAMIPEHWKGVTAARLVIPADQISGELVLTFADSECGPFNLPLTVRAKLETKTTPVHAEASLEVVK